MKFTCHIKIYEDIDRDELEQALNITIKADNQEDLFWKLAYRYGWCKGKVVENGEKIGWHFSQKVKGMHKYTEAYIRNLCEKNTFSNFKENVFSANYVTAS